MCGVGNLASRADPSSRRLDTQLPAAPPTPHSIPGQCQLTPHYCPHPEKSLVISKMSPTRQYQPHCRVSSTPCHLHTQATGVQTKLWLKGETPALSGASSPPPEGVLAGRGAGHGAGAEALKARNDTHAVLDSWEQLPQRAAWQ